MDTELNYIESCPDRVQWGESYTFDLPLRDGKLGLVLATYDSPTNVGLTYTVVTNVKPQCTVQNLSVLHPGIRILEINGTNITDRDQEGINGILRRSIQGSSVNLTLIKPNIPASDSASASPCEFQPPSLRSYSGSFANDACSLDQSSSDFGRYGGYQYETNDPGQAYGQSQGQAGLDLDEHYTPYREPETKTGTGTATNRAHLHEDQVHEFMPHRFNGQAEHRPENSNTGQNGAVGHLEPDDRGYQAGFCEFTPDGFTGHRPGIPDHRISDNGKWCHGLNGAPNGVDNARAQDFALNCRQNPSLYAPENFQDHGRFLVYRNQIAAQLYDQERNRIPPGSIPDNRVLTDQQNPPELNRAHVHNGENWSREHETYPALHGEGEGGPYQKYARKLDVSRTDNITQNGMYQMNNGTDNGNFTHGVGLIPPHPDVNTDQTLTPYFYAQVLDNGPRPLYDRTNQFQPPQGYRDDFRSVGDPLSDQLNDTDKRNSLAHVAVCEQVENRVTDQAVGSDDSLSSNELGHILAKVARDSTCVNAEVHISDASTPEAPETNGPEECGVETSRTRGISSASTASETRPFSASTSSSSGVSSHTENSSSVAAGSSSTNSSNERPQYKPPLGSSLPQITSLDLPNQRSHTNQGPQSLPVGPRSLPEGHRKNTSSSKSPKRKSFASFWDRIKKKPSPKPEVQMESLEEGPGSTLGHDSAYKSSESEVREEAVNRPGSIKWEIGERLVTLKKKNNMFGFSCKVKEVSTEIMYIVDEVTDAPANTVLKRGDMLLSINGEPLQYNGPYKEPDVFKQEVSKDEVDLLIKSPQEINRKKPAKTSPTPGDREVASSENVIIDFDLDLRSDNSLHPPQPGRQRSNLQERRNGHRAPGAAPVVSPHRNANGPRSATEPNLPNSSGASFQSERIPDGTPLVSEVLRKALNDLAGASCKRVPFANIMLIVPDESYVDFRDLVFSEFGGKQSKILTVHDGEQKEEAWTQSRSIQELVLTKLLCEKLQDVEKSCLRKNCNGQNTVLGLPMDLFEQFLNKAPNPRADYVQVSVRAVPYSDVRAGWECARFTDNTVYLVAVDAGSWSPSVREVLTRIKMHTSAEQRECVVLTLMHENSHVDTNSIGEAMGREFCSTDATDHKPFDRLLCRRPDKRNNPLFVASANKTGIKGILGQFYRLLFEPKSSLKRPFPVLGMVLGQQLSMERQRQRQAATAKCTEHLPVTMTHVTIRTMLQELIQGIDDKAFESTLQALHQAGLIIYPPHDEKNTVLNMLVVHDIEGFIKYGKMIRPVLTARNAWKATDSHIREKLEQKADMNNVLQFMQELHLVATVSNNSTDLRGAGNTNENIVAFPYCFSGVRPQHLSRTKQSLFIDFNKFFALGYFVQLVEDIGSRYKAVVRMETPYQAVMIQDGFELRLEYIPEKALVHCNVCFKENTSYPVFYQWLEDALAECIPEQWRLRYRLGPLCDCRGHIVDVRMPSCSGLAPMEKSPTVLQWRPEEKLSQEQKECVLKEKGLATPVHHLPATITDLLENNLNRTNDGREDWRGLCNQLQKTADEIFTLERNPNPTGRLLREIGPKHNGTLRCLLYHLKAIYKVTLIEEICNCLSRDYDIHVNPDDDDDDGRANGEFDEFNRVSNC